VLGRHSIRLGMGSEKKMRKRKIGKKVLANGKAMDQAGGFLVEPNGQGNCASGHGLVHFVNLSWDGLPGGRGGLPGAVDAGVVPRTSVPGGPRGLALIWEVSGHAALLPHLVAWALGPPTRVPIASRPATVLPLRGGRPGHAAHSLQGTGKNRDVIRAGKSHYSWEGNLPRFHQGCCITAEGDVLRGPLDQPKWWSGWPARRKGPIQLLAAPADRSGIHTG
jgi:hypothetical protein